MDHRCRETRLPVHEGQSQGGCCGCHDTSAAVPVNQVSRASQPSRPFQHVSLLPLYTVHISLLNQAPSRSLGCLHQLAARGRSRHTPEPAAKSRSLQGPHVTRDTEARSHKLCRLPLHLRRTWTQFRCATSGSESRLQGTGVTTVVHVVVVVMSEPRHA